MKDPNADYEPPKDDPALTGPDWAMGTLTAAGAALFGAAIVYLYQRKPWRRR